MVVLFTVIEQPGTLTTYNGYEVIDAGLDSVRTPENAQKTKIEPGTLLVNLIDATSSKIAWQAYASGILRSDMVNDDFESKRHSIPIV
jgi:hypothetical protein